MSKKKTKAKNETAQTSIEPVYKPPVIVTGFFIIK